MHILERSRFLTPLLTLVLLTVGCATQAPEADAGKSATVSSGAFAVESSEFEFPASLTIWQARLEARNDAFAAAEGREAVVYELYVSGAAAGDSGKALGLQLRGTSWSLFSADSIHALADADTSGEKNQVDVKVDSTYYVSDGGEVQLTSMEAGRIAGVIDTSLVQLGEGDRGVALTGGFEGVVEASCTLYDFEAEEDGSWSSVGVEDPRCAVLFD